MGLVRSYAVLLVSLLPMAMGIAIGVVMLSTLRIQLAPPDKVGRVVAFGRLISWAVPGLLGGVLGGARQAR